MNKIIFSLLLVLSSFSAFSQEADFEQKYHELFVYIEKEDWANAEILSFDLKESIESKDTLDNEKKILRYLYIYSVSGLMCNKIITKQEGLKKTMPLWGKEMIMPARSFSPGCMINCIQFAKEGTSTFFTCVNDSVGTKIMSYEYTIIRHGVKESATELLGKNIILKGKLNKVSVEGSLFPRFKLNFVNGDYEILE